MERINDGDDDDLVACCECACLLGYRGLEGWSFSCLRGGLCDTCVQKLVDLAAAPRASKTVSAVRDYFVADPPSRAIAQLLEAEARVVCKHDRNPCLLRCGVRRDYVTGRWMVVPFEYRIAWLDRVETQAARDVAERAVSGHKKP